MKRTMKRWLSALLCLLLLGGCNPQQTGGSSLLSTSSSGTQSLSSSASWASSEQSMPAISDAGESASSDTGQTAQGEISIRLRSDGKEATAVLFDNPTSQSLISQLPVVVSFADFAGAEKIVYLPIDLSTNNTTSGFDPVVGDIACYAPWKNMAIYYKDQSYDAGLILMGKVTTGMAFLSELREGQEVVIELVE